MASFREIATDALRYWERQRPIYNGVLAAIVVALFAAFLPQSRDALTWNTLFQALVLAVLANLLYCTAYIPDVFVQFSDFRDGWRQRRWMLFAIGLIIASALTFMASVVLIATTALPGMD